MNTDHFYLTNGSCENAGFVGARWMEGIGLEFGEADSFFYPLTKEEARFIGNDKAAIGDSGMEAWLSFSILYLNRKWLAPVIEIVYQGPRCTDLALPPRELAYQASKQIHTQLVNRVYGVGGHTFKSESANRFWIEIVLPFKLAAKYGDFNGWKNFLENELFAGVSIKVRREELQSLGITPVMSPVAVGA